MVTSVSPSCTNIEASNKTSSLSNLQDIALARAVTDAVSSQAFIAYHLTISYARILHCDIVVGTTDAIKLLMIYFPTQKRRKISSVTSLVTRLPVNSYSADSASSTQMPTASSVLPATSASAASPMASNARAAQAR